MLLIITEQLTKPVCTRLPHPLRREAKHPPQWGVCGHRVCSSRAAIGSQQASEMVAIVSVLDTFVIIFNMLGNSVSFFMSEAAVGSDPVH